MPALWQSSSSRHPSQPTEGEQSDEDVEMKSPPRSPAEHSPKNFKPLLNQPFESTFSSPLKMRITGSQGRPLFPTSRLPRESSEVAPKGQGSDDCSKDNNSAPKEKPRFDALEAFLNYQLEELKRRPPLGSSKGCADQHGEGDDEFEKMDVDDEDTAMEGDGGVTNE
ncbi:hypothetical protein F4677DRAFT_366831 [Hypoxylon crocopeplum]|nr:hypothetical protein F4677DRAFT_366831 [Hypoxylon crocopeplum]